MTPARTDRTGAPVTERPQTDAADRKAAMPSVRSAIRVGRARTEDVAPKTKEADAYRPQAYSAHDATQVKPADVPVGSEPSAAAGAQAKHMDVDALIPELLSDLETALADGAIRAASTQRQDAAIRNESAGEREP